MPILYYHRAEAPPATFKSWSLVRRRLFITYDVIPSALAAQLDWLAVHGYTTILPRDLAAHWDHGAKLPVRPVIVTFDDGSHDWVTTVLPLLKARHMVAEFYLTLDAIRVGAISWADVRALAAAGNGIGAHDVHHFQLANVGRGRPAASSATMWAEVSGARRIIAAKIGVPPDSMAYVGGGFDPRLEALVRKAGYSTARCILRGVAQSVDRRFEMRVVRVGARDDVVDLLTGQLVPGLPTFSARMRGASDIPSA
ncbi:MAG: polysaccharide deacetylase family protein [Chloroflexota bacterium]|nr:polysaccharide deacetylase family protein [Chloroflexota bacterium]